ncbi:methylenetetrahydrofolate reductase C-terminal domain-containing protein [Chloroflexota bacterium]
MILSKQKPWEEILGYLGGEKNVFILGCNGCAQASGTGGLEQVKEMESKLEGIGKKVMGSTVIDFLCEKALVKSRLRNKVESIKAADSILVMTCGIGVQAVAASVKKVCHPACDTANLGGSRGEWKGNERCMECGECLLEYTGGICPLTACTKGLINGQCGGASQGKCEIDPVRDCGWEMIYKRLKDLNQLGKLKMFVTPKDYSKMKPDVKILSTSHWALEQTDQKERD